MNQMNTRTTWLFVLFSVLYITHASNATVMMYDMIDFNHYYYLLFTGKMDNKLDYSYVLAGSFTILISIRSSKHTITCLVQLLTSI
ncbi:hypothetical protein BDF22DRAFT_698192 [Syncephalis plumigaleata]|nr:hypothetical protein BDF22DRAFT_698192 [Syncephalis plumigaleata]